MPSRRPPMGRLSCSNCNVTLAYPVGCTMVRCPQCWTRTRAEHITVMCVTCRSVIILPKDVHLAMCPRCRTIMNIPGYIRNPPDVGPPLERVFVERPPKKLPNGSYEKCLGVGTKLNDDEVPSDKKPIVNP